MDDSGSLTNAAVMSLILLALPSAALGQLSVTGEWTDYWGTQHTISSSVCACGPKA